MENVFLFTGENAYALRQERERWVRNFVEKHGEQNLLLLEGKTLNVGDLLDVVSIAPFLGGHRLVVIAEIPTWTKEEMENVLAERHPQTILLFTSLTPDRRQGVTKVLLEKALVKVFPLVVGPSLRQWVGHILSREGASMTPAAKSMLLERVGEDQDMLETELTKLMTFAGTREIQEADIEALVPPSREWVVWNLTDYLSRKRRCDALLYADTLIRSGQDPVGLWTVLLWMVRSMVTVAGAIDEEKNPTRIDGLHPRTVRSLVALVHSMTAQDLRVIVDETVQADIRLKVGEYRVTVEEPQELIALIDRLILRCT